MKFNPKRLSYKDFTKIYSTVPRLCVDIVIKKRLGVLLSKRSIKPAKGYWHIPGGTILFGEKLKDAINRISCEELGSKVKIVKLLGVIEYFPPSVHGHSISLVYLCEPKLKKLRGSWQATEVEYFKKIPQKTIKQQKRFLKELLS